MMEISEFVKNFADCFEDTDAKEITPQTEFKNLEEWDSLLTLAVIGMCHKKYNVKITGAEIRESITVQDIFNLVSSKKE